MFDIVCVTSSALCGDNFLKRLERICDGGIDRVILREKQLSLVEYVSLFKKCDEICKAYNIPLFAHGKLDALKILRAKNIHLPYSVFTAERENLVSSNFNICGTSVHSISDAEYAEKNGAGYITAGHIFKTDCKKYLAPRGLEFLSEVCKAVKIPVYAIGGISPHNIESVRSSGASGACIMSELMKTDNPARYIAALRQSLCGIPGKRL